MAQHVEIRNAKVPKILQKIGKRIEEEVRNGLSRTSMKWNYRGFIGETIAVEVWETWRYIGNGIVWGDTTGYFEVHVNGNIAEHIYLVA